MKGRPFVPDSAGPRLSAHIHLAILHIAAVLFRSVRIRGFSHFVKAVARVAPRRDFAILRHQDGARVKILLGDPYWVVPLLRDGAYEPEVEHVLDLVVESTSLFIDCGANIGYWSAVAASKIGRPRATVAIEASTNMLQQLVDNAKLNDDSFTVIHAAVWERPAMRIPVAVDTERHSWASADPGVRERLLSAGFTDQEVTTTTIDEAVSTLARTGTGNVIVKLDVEGSEISALKGAHATLQEDVLLIYEDHARDLDSHVTRFVMDELGFAVFHCAPCGSITPVSLPTIRSMKMQRATGYNFFACNKDSDVYRRITGSQE